SLSKASSTARRRGWPASSASAAKSCAAQPPAGPATDATRPTTCHQSSCMIRIAQPLIGEEEKTAVMAVLDSGQLAAGPVTRQFEEAFAAEVSRTSEAVAVSNGTAALHIALLALGIGPGDEVITTPFTFQATGNMILASGARPVFVDVGDDGNINPALIETAI